MRYILIIFGLVLMWASTSRTVMSYISNKRDVDKWWGSYQGLHGDLVSMSYLDFVQEFNQPAPRKSFRHPVSDKKNTVLYLDGDSHTWHLGDSDFAGLYAFNYFQRSYGCKYHLDATKRNVLLIEISERYLQSYFNGLQLFNEVYDSTIKKQGVSYLSMPENKHTRYASLFGNISIDDLFNKNINQNLQCNLFNYNFIMPMFEYKAALNYYLFNRASGDVVISNDRKFLFYQETVSRTDMGSSYYPVSPGDAAHIVDNLNAVYDHYKAAGFAEVYVSIIPNSATIMQPQGYNDLIPMVQNDKRLRMKLIDIYSVFKNSKEVYFLTGDTHWNFKGKQLWLDMVNERILHDAD